MIVRISEIEVYPEYLKEYMEFAHNVGATSVEQEPGVICIYPMQQKKMTTRYEYWRYMLHRKLTKVT